MEKKELSDYVLKSVEVAKRKANEDGNTKPAQDYINELRNFYTQQGDKGAYLNDFRQYLFNTGCEAPNPLYVKFTRDLMKRYKSGRIFMGIAAAAGFAGAPACNAMAIPALFFGYLAIKMHSHYGRYKKEMEKVEAKEAEMAKLEKIASEVSNTELEDVLNENKEDIMRQL